MYSQLEKESNMKTKWRVLSSHGARWMAVCASLLGATPAYSGNWSFLEDTPISYMNPRDRAALNQAAQTALDTRNDGESLDWSNSGTGNTVLINGTVTPRSTVKTGDQVCRTITLVANAKGQTQSWTPTACKKGNGAWAIKKQ
jgi:surface antigen